MPPPLIVLADDEPHITMMVAEKLRSAGCSVAVARNGREAFDLAVRLRPDLVVTDCQMPNGSGIDLALKMAQTPATAHIPILVLSARGYILDPEMVKRTRITQVLGKPFSAREVVRRIVELIASRAASASPDAEPPSQVPDGAGAVPESPADRREAA